MAQGTTARGDVHAVPAEARQRGGDTNAEADLRTAVAGAVERLAAAIGCPRIAVWDRHADGSLRVLAATPAASPPGVRDVGLLDALAGLARPVDLGGPDAGAEAATRPDAEAATRPGAEAAARLVELGFTAAAPVAPDSGPAAAWLLAGGDDDAPGAVRPRTLAALAAAAARLAGPVRAAAASARLAALDAPVRRLDALASLGEMLAEVLHEVRNPLVSVKTFLQLLPDRADDPEFRSEFVEVVGEEVRRIERLLDAVLHHARTGPSEEDEVLGPVAPVLESVARLLGPRARREGIALEVEAPPELTLPMDVDALRQVALNLALNALDATPAGGAVRLSAGVEDDGSFVLDCDDDGPGVPPEWRERMFEPFASTRADRPGGLGLALARRMAEERGASLEAADREGGGTRLRLRFPPGAG